MNHSLPPGTEILTVAEVNNVARTVLEEGFPSIWVTGEVSNFTRAASGHLYFTLKDANAELRAVMWRGMALRLKFDPTAGLHVLARGNLTVYQQKGTFQLVCAELYPKGEGALDLALRQLREKLFARGWFDAKRKKPLATFPRQIAVVTSPTGAAVRDMLETITRRWPSVEIVVVPVRVQGDGAGEEIAEAIRLLNRLRLAGRLSPDLMIVGRGGGSLEDLWAFNEEVVAQAIYESAIPVVSAVGHETDVTIADLVADQRAMTPTHAATAVVPDRLEMLAAVRDWHARLTGGLTRRLELARRRLAELAARRVLRLPLDRVRERERRLDEIAGRLHRAGRRRIDRGREKTDAVAARLHGVSPLNVLARGYSVTQNESGGVIRDAAQARPGDRIRTRLHRGRLVSRVEAMQFEPET
jgi:exodeoxyribonuclease VII large subunit